MKLIPLSFLFALLPAIPCSASDAQVGQAAPDFSAVDSHGKTRKLSGYKGQVVVLEWTNINCPLVKKHYETHNMQKLQKDLAAKEVVWFTVISSAKGKPGYCTPEEANAAVKERGASPTAVLLDADGRVGRLFGVKTTPTMIVIDQKGVLRYQGAIDSDCSPDPTTIPGATNYVKAAVEEVLAGRAVSQPVTQAYGCSVKY